MKHGSDIYRKSNYATFYLFLYFSIVHSDNGLYIYTVLSVEKKSLKVVNNTPTIGL